MTKTIMGITAKMYIGAAGTFCKSSGGVWCCSCSSWDTSKMFVVVPEAVSFDKGGVLLAIPTPSTFRLRSFWSNCTNDNDGEVSPLWVDDDVMVSWGTRQENKKIIDVWGVHKVHYYSSPNAGVDCLMSWWWWYIGTFPMPSSDSDLSCVYVTIPCLLAKRFDPSDIRQYCLDSHACTHMPLTCKDEVMTCLAMSIWCLWHAIPCLFPSPDKTPRIKRCDDRVGFARPRSVYCQS